MSRVQDTFTVCDQCGGAIPDSAPAITGVAGTLRDPGVGNQGFNELDFCCTEHASTWLSTHGNVPTPSPLYPPPPAPA